MKTEVLTGSFEQAVIDYYWLRNRHYPEHQSLKLVGDRYRLSGDQRNILYRGITDPESARRRNSRLIHQSDIANSILLIDGYNVLLTVTAYLLGRPVFMANDGFLRDAGSSYGRIEKFQNAVQLMSRFLADLRHTGLSLNGLICVIDKPVENSSHHAAVIREAMVQVDIPCEVLLADSADKELKQRSQQEKDIVIATSDSGIIDAAACGTYDLARHLFEARFRGPDTDSGDEMFPVICPAGLL